MKRAVLVLAWLVACGGRAPGTVTGTLDGKSFVPSDAVFFVTANGSVDTSIEIATTGGICGLMSSDRPLKNAQLLTLSINSSGTVSAGQSFTVGQHARAAYSQVDATCHEVDHSDAMSGTVAVTAVSSDALSGTFDLMMGVGSGTPHSHVTGTFHATPCNGAIGPLVCP